MGFVRLMAWLRLGQVRRALSIACLLLPLVAVVAGSAWVRAEYPAQKGSISHDEAISLIAAAGRQDQYESVMARAVGRWVDASELLLLNAVDAGRGFAGVREGLLKTDIHPPLYFWLVNATARLGDGTVRPSDGVWVNVVAHVFGVILLYWLSRRLGNGHAVAALTAALWTFSSSTMATTATIRQYELLAVTATATTLCLVGAAVSRRILVWCAAFCLAAWAALSTQLQAVALLACTAVMMVIASISAFRARDRTQRAHPRVLGVAAALGVACLFAYWTFPGAVGELARRVSSLESAPESERSLSLLKPIGAFLNQSGRAAEVIAVALVAAALALALFHGVRLMRESSLEQRERALLALFAPVCFLIVTGLVARQQANFSDERGAGTRYWAITFPFCALVLGQTVTTLSALAVALWKKSVERARWRLPLEVPKLGGLARAALYVGLSAAIGFVAVTRPPASTLLQTSPAFGSLVPLYDRLIVAGTNRGAVGRIIPFLDPHARIFLTNGAPRGSERERLRSELGKPRSVLLIVSPRRRSAPAKERHALRKELKRAGFELQPASYAAALDALRKSVVFFAESASPSKDSDQGKSTLSRLSAARGEHPGGYVGVRDSGRWLAERAGDRVSLSSRRLAIEGIPGYFKMSARSRDDDHLAEIRFESRAFQIPHSGVVAAVWDRRRSRLRFIGPLEGGELRGMYAARK